MIRATLFVILIGLTTTAFPQNAIRLEIGAKLPKRYVPKAPNLVATEAAQMRPYVEVVQKGVRYLAAYDKESLRIRYLSTSDENFVTSDGRKIDSEIAFTVDDLIIFPYFEIRAPAGKDGWYPVIAHDYDLGGGPFIHRLKKGERATMTISKFVKGSN